MTSTAFFHADSQIRLSTLPIGQKAKVVGFEAGGRDRSRLFEMGVTLGAVIETVRVAPLGDPIDFKVRGYHLSLRRAEAAGIQVELL